MHHERWTTHGWGFSFSLRACRTFNKWYSTVDLKKPNTWFHQDAEGFKLAKFRAMFLYLLFSRIKNGTLVSRKELRNKTKQNLSTTFATRSCPSCNGFKISTRRFVCYWFPLSPLWISEDWNYFLKSYKLRGHLAGSGEACDSISGLWVLAPGWV